MTRRWTEWIADLADLVWGGVPMLILLSLLGAIVVALAWYFWPAWLPWNWHWGEGRTRSEHARRGGPRPGWRVGALRWRLRWRWRRRRRDRVQPAAELGPEDMPDLPAAQLTLTADELAAAGRFAEAVRERLRAIIRDLIELDLLAHTPGWTVRELAAAATSARPTLEPPLGSAVDVFSEIWYGLRPATAVDDLALREYAAVVGQLARALRPIEAAVPQPASTGGIR
jgi:hypothetical protein